MRLTERITGYILSSISLSDGTIELQRKDLAEHFGCVPSQINYVLETRFAPEQGYIVETRRGGGGYIRITRINLDRKALLMNTVLSIGSSIDLQTVCGIITNLESVGAISNEIAQFSASVLGDAALKAAPPEIRNKLRAAIIKQIILNTVK